MTDNYAKIANDNLCKLYKDLPPNLAEILPARQEADRFIFQAFGETCVISPDGISWGEKQHSSVFDILISLYALNARPDACRTGTVPVFQGIRQQHALCGRFYDAHGAGTGIACGKIKKTGTEKIKTALSGIDIFSEVGGDFSFVVHPLPKIALCYIFYDADEDFPASVTCLFSNNAHLFLPVDGLADTGEYTSKKIIEITG